MTLPAMTAEAWVLPAAGAAYLTWAVASFSNPSVRLLRVTSRRLLPGVAIRAAQTPVGRWLLWTTALCARTYRPLYLLRYLFGLIPPAAALLIFFSRLHAGRPLDLLLLPAAFLIAILTHETGHSILYTLAGDMVLSIQTALPLHGQTRALQAAEPKYRANVALAGGTANLMTALPWAAAWLLTGNALLLYLALANLCLFATILFPITKDYQDLAAARLQTQA